MSELTIREACRQRMRLEGVDAQALENALLQAERELASASARAERAEGEVARLAEACGRLTRERTVWGRRAEAANGECGRLRAAIRWCEEARLLARMEVRCATCKYDQQDFDGCATCVGHDGWTAKPPDDGGGWRDWVTDPPPAWQSVAVEGIGWRQLNGISRLAHGRWRPARGEGEGEVKA